MSTIDSTDYIFPMAQPHTFFSPRPPPPLTNHSGVVSLNSSAKAVPVVPSDSPANYKHNEL